MKKAIRFIVPLSIILFAYFLFEPIVVHNIGRKKLPELPSNLVSQNSNFEEADEILIKAYGELGAPALSVAVAIRDKLVYSNVIGFADLDQKILADSLTQFRIGSVSKAITSAGLGVLLKNGQLNINTTAKDLVPYVSQELATLTLSQIASHTSGIRNYRTCLCFPIWEYYNNNTYKSVKESVHIFNGDALLFEPGTDFSYSSYNYTLLSAMIESASELDFLNFMKKSVFEPLELAQTTADHRHLEPKNIATFYNVENRTYKESYTVDNSNKWAGGGFLSTPQNLVKFGSAMLNYKLIDTLTTQTLFTPIKLKNGTLNSQNYALGWRNDISSKVFKDQRKTRVIHHGGVAMGSTALLILLPEYNMAVAITMNKNNKSFDLFPLAYALAEAISEKYY